MSPTFLLGLDGATFRLLDELAAPDGVMPYLGSLIREGTHAVLRSTPHPLTPPAWTTIATGMNPGNHGIYDFLRVQVGGENALMRLNDFRCIGCETIWTMTSNRGGSVNLLNFPLTSPPPAIRGSVVPGLMSWKHLRRNILPAGLFDEISAMPGFDAKQISWDFESEKKALLAMAEDELEGWVEFHILRERRWFEILSLVTERHPADLTAIVFDGVDKLQHACWRHLDPDLRGRYGSPADVRLRELCLEYFRALDGFIRESIEKLGPQTRCFICSDHGFGPSDFIFRVNEWLASEGHLRWLDDATKAEATPGNYIPVDWNNTVAYAPSAAANGIHIRVATAPGQTGIAPENYREFVAKLTRRLLELRHPTSGQPLLQKVLHRDDVFTGQYRESAPDLTLVMSDHGFVSVLHQLPVIEQRQVPIGTHAPDGIFIATGPGIRRSVRMEPLDIVDIAPTLLYSLGLDVPESLDGEIIRGCFEAEHLRSNPPRRVASVQADVETSGTDIDEEEEGLVMDRLRALGYIE